LRFEDVVCQGATIVLVVSATGDGECPRCGTPSHHVHSRYCRTKSKKKNPEPTGIDQIDKLASLDRCTIQDYVAGVSAYVRLEGTLAAGPKKAAQIRLSNALARSLSDELSTRLPHQWGGSR
jgi:hypothetical protein